ncbi:hypothetical protein BDI4_50057 [Burkholderia diffusa]|nr:hypothetical protein BDI4_50057 [Burkholderia diffusa]
MIGYAIHAVKAARRLSMMRCGTIAPRVAWETARGKARRAGCGAAETAMKGTEPVRGAEFGLHDEKIRYIIAILRFIACFTPWPPHRPSTPGCPGPTHSPPSTGSRGRRCAARSTNACWPRSARSARTTCSPSSSRSAAACRRRPSIARWISSSSTASSTGSNRRTRSSRAARSACRTKASS